MAWMLVSNHKITSKQLYRQDWKSVDYITVWWEVIAVSLWQNAACEHDITLCWPICASQVMLLVNRLKTNIFFVTRECALKIALTRSIFSAQNAPNIICRPGSTRTRWGSLQRSSRHPSCIKGCLLLREGRREGGNSGICEYSSLSVWLQLGIW